MGRGKQFPHQQKAEIHVYIYTYSVYIYICIYTHEVHDLLGFLRHYTVSSLVFMVYFDLTGNKAPKKTALMMA